ncbi:MAG TPA: hypothetical protein VMV89_03385 [Candidatus Paceibacterota bacterium]|nr:hypothetical protein [Candidatus Paceibacterota bacterium]
MDLNLLPCPRLLKKMYRIHHADCFDWLRDCKPRPLHTVCTDPPHCVLEFTEKEVAKLRAGSGGVWRLPPAIGGSQRDPLPRFTVLTDAQKLELRRFFHEWGKALWPALVPGGNGSCRKESGLQNKIRFQK